MKTNELDASSIFATDDKDNDRKMLKQAVNADTIPGNYIKVKLSSLGKLSAPPILHVRNYTFEEALELSDMTNENEKEVIINVLDKLIWEDFDASLLHEQEALEILLNIFGAWWGTKLEGFRYFVDEDLPEDKREKPENRSIAEIPLANIKTTELKKEVKEPVLIENKEGFSIKLMLPRMQTGIIARKFVDQKFIAEENRFLKIKKAISNNEDYDIDEYKEYLSYLKERGKEYLRVYQAQLIHSVNGQEIEDLSEAIDLLPEIDLSFWKKYNKIVEDHYQFGIDPLVKFNCTINNKPIERRFQFRAMVFLPSMESENDTGYTFSFG
jgi:hypothetical protein